MKVEELMPQGFACPKCGSRRFRPESDTMDVWFDSGSSHFGVLENPSRWPEQRWPADMYLEGSDQHRGWFNSSLCVAVANRGVAPYRQVLTHGFLVDEEGKKQSKSLGNYIDPLQMMDEVGADVLRLWVASTDYRSDITNSRAIFKQVGESYRKIRNTLRYLLGNLYDFEPERHAIPFEKMPELDRWAMIRLNRLVEQVLKAYAEYEFHVVYHAIHKFCVVDMSAFYLDVAKDTLYAELPDDPARRSLQTVLYHMADNLLRLLTPVLAFTTEEVYSYLVKPAKAPLSVQLLDMPCFAPALTDAGLEEKWQRLLDLREIISRELEAARQAKVIGHSLDAALALYPDPASYELLASVKEQLAHMLIVSQVKLFKPDEERPAAAQGEAELALTVSTARGVKCGRCWIYSEQADENALCPRCAAVLRSQVY
jgi:isoleucyl-tRNA synthetase